MPKYIRRIIAFLRQTFVTDCPRCYNYFYGFNEYKFHLKFEDGKGKKQHYRVVCHRCADNYSKIQKEDTL